MLLCFSYRTLITGLIQQGGIKYPFVQPTRDSTPNPAMTSATLSRRPFAADIVGVATTRAYMLATFPTKVDGAEEMRLGEFAHKCKEAMCYL